jgi:hypothetical protein
MRPPIGERNPPGNDLAMERLLRQSTLQTLDVCHDGAAPPRRETAELSSRSVTIDAAVQMATEPGQTSFTGAGSAAAGVVNPQVLICILFSGHCRTHTHTYTHTHTHTHAHTHTHTHTHIHTHTHTHTLCFRLVSIAHFISQFISLSTLILFGFFIAAPIDQPKHQLFSIRITWLTSSDAHLFATSFAQLLRRIKQEIKAVHSSPHPGFDVYPSESNISFWKVVMEAPTDDSCLYSGGTYVATPPCVNSDV